MEIALGFGRQILGSEPKGHELKSVPSTAGIKFMFSYEWMLGNASAAQAHHLITWAWNWCIEIEHFYFGDRFDAKSWKSNDSSVIVSQVFSLTLRSDKRISGMAYSSNATQRVMSRYLSICEAYKGNKWGFDCGFTSRVNAYRRLVWF